MHATNLTPVVDVTTATWIEPLLSGRPGTVTGTVPAGFDAYARICHPVVGEHDNPVTWAQDAERTGGYAHPTMQWHALIGSTDRVNPSSAL